MVHGLCLKQRFSRIGREMTFRLNTDRLGAGAVRAGRLVLAEAARAEPDWRRVAMRD